MINLIKKDLILSRMYIAIWSVFNLLLGFSIVLSESISSMYIRFAVYVMFLSFVVFLGMMENEIKNNADVLILSLPVDRKSIVTGKYVTYILILLFFSVFHYFQVLYFIFSRNWNTPYVPFGYISLNLIFIAIGLGVITGAIVIFLYYLILYKKKEMAKFSTVIVYLMWPIGILSLGFNYEGSALEGVLMNENISIIFLGFLLISLIIYMLSMKASIYLYNKTEI
ncbi:ABC-2 transporter permease [Tissierella sp. Yu-01]|uniref:ABC-2 transporter permease n=1 Tax=Tissierella sp. Yu-01 TaxID=3035694 RepID=UPI00240E5487|nr:ABC-2 transporter permease [Tissierella sp. Yu-01]WFA08111.1 ABC-2 transporter permease [Tissierella sp. Yu-01]